MKRGAVLFIIGILAPWAGAATLRARPFTLEDVVAFRTIDDLRVSPDGKAVVFALTGARLEEGRYETDLYLVRLEDGGPVRRLTSADADDEKPRWSPDGRRIAFLSGRGGAKQVWVLRREGGEAEQVTGHPQPIAWFDWAPDGRRMLVVAPPPESDDEAGRKKIKDDAVVVGRHWRNHRLWLSGAAPGSRPAPPQPLTGGATHVQKAL
ncbi:MAG TPA: hypothetical protein VFX28_09885, partial [Methylomirabilota bacterium]|nr:hypothetical protein [Methylomirabilota bacterium]